MDLETDADRREMLLALGGSEEITVEGERLSAALFTSEPRGVGFENITISTDSRALFCLTSEVKARSVKQGQTIVVPGVADELVVADIQDDAGMTLLELRRA